MADVHNSRSSTFAARQLRAPERGAIPQVLRSSKVARSYAYSCFLTPSVSSCRKSFQIVRSGGPPTLTAVAESRQPRLCHDLLRASTPVTLLPPCHLPLSRKKYIAPLERSGWSSRLGLEARPKPTSPHHHLEQLPSSPRVVVSGTVTEATPMCDRGARHCLDSRVPRRASTR